MWIIPILIFVLAVGMMIYLGFRDKALYRRELKNGKTGGAGKALTLAAASEEAK